MRYVMMVARALYVLVGGLLAVAAYWLWGVILWMLRFTAVTGGVDMDTIWKFVACAVVTVLVFAAYGLGFLRLFRKTARRVQPDGAF